MREYSQRQDISKYKNLFPHVSAAIQLRNDTGQHPMKGDAIQSIYTNSQHNNPLFRVVPIAIDNAQADFLSQYDKEKYKEMILDAAETVLSWGSWALIELFIVAIPKRTKEEGNGMTSLGTYRLRLWNNNNKGKEQFRNAP